MCTVTFMPRKAGYCLAMNRDEQRSRPQGLPPTPRRWNGGLVICPSEPTGGTWIALNERAASWALINYYAVKQRVAGAVHSRGEVIPMLNAASSWRAAQTRLEGIALDRINPFRLIGVFPATREITEWRWDLNRLTRCALPWVLQQWISSGFDEAKAQMVRGRAFEAAQRQQAVGDLRWLRCLHRSHLPEPGPFSTCMHRADAVTVSYTEVCVWGRRARMSHTQGAPCGQDAG